MKLANIRYQNEDRLAVVLDDERLLDLSGLKLASSMIGLIERGTAGLEEIQTALREPNPDAIIPSSAVIWHPPVRQPRKILCVAMNNASSNARKLSAPNHPLYFNKVSTSLVGHQQPIVVYDYYGSVHPEPELAVMIGKGGRNIAAEDAEDAVYGYSNFNDITGNGMRSEDRVHYMALYASKDDPEKPERREQHLSYAARYKGADTFGPLGPYLVTRDEVPNPNDLDVTCTFGNEIIAQDSTRYYNYPVHHVIAFMSRYHTLEAGDIISMGTAFKPSPDSKRSLHTANMNQVQLPVSMSITGLGTLYNPVEKRA